MRNRVKRWQIGVGLLLGMWLGAAMAAAQGPVDVVLVMDSSGSMKRTDPQRLRVPTARLFISLLAAGDRVGVISFSDQGYPVVGLSAVSERGPLFAAVDKVSSRGAFTNLYAALHQARAMLAQAEPGRQRHIVFMSDGKMDVGDTERDLALTVAIEQEVIPRLQAEGIRVHTIAFSDEADKELLRATAEHTGGLFQLARSDRDLAAVFAAIFEASKQPDMLPIKGGEFVTDESLQEVTIVASKEGPEVGIFLQGPDGRRYQEKDHPASMHWFSSQYFEMITLPKPQVGRWQVLFSSGDNRAYIVTDLALATDFEADKVPSGDSPLVSGWMERGGERIEQPEMLLNTAMIMELGGPDEQQSLHPLNDEGKLIDPEAGDGRYTGRLHLTRPGQYKLTLYAKGRTFQRQLVRYFRVEGEPALPTGETSVVKPEPVPMPVAEEPTPAEPPLAEGQPAAAKHYDLWWVLGMFALFNVILAALIVIVWLVLRLRRGQREE